MVAKSRHVYKVADPELQYIFNSIQERLDKVEGIRNALVVPLEWVLRSHEESTTTNSTLIVDLGTVVAGDFVMLMVNGDFTLSSAADGQVQYQIGKSAASSASITNASSTTLPRIGITTNVSGAGTQYYFGGTFILKVTVGGTLRVGISSRAAVSVTVSSNVLRVAAMCLIGIPES